MMRYVKTIDELIEFVDREFFGPDAVCPICKKSLGSVNLSNVELGLPELKFTQFKYPGVYCTEGHCIISMEEPLQTGKREKSAGGDCRIYIEDLGLKVFEVMRLIKPFLNVDESVPNAQIYWMLMDKNNPTYLKGLNREQALELLEKLQKLGARACIA